MNDSEYYHCNYCDWNWKKDESPFANFKIDSDPPKHFCGVWCKEQFKKDYGHYFGIQ